MASEKGRMQKLACKDVIVCFLNLKCWIKIFELSIHSQVASNWKKLLYTRIMSVCWGVQKPAIQQLSAFVKPLPFPPCIKPLNWTSAKPIWFIQLCCKATLPWLWIKFQVKVPYFQSWASKGFFLFPSSLFLIYFSNSNNCHWYCQYVNRFT